MAASPQDLARALVAREERRRAELDVRRAAIIEQARGAAQWLVDVHGAGSVHLFGSWIWGGAHDASDVDIAVGGLPHAALSAAHTELEGLIPGVVVELIRIEDLVPAFRGRILRDGLRLP